MISTVNNYIMWGMSGTTSGLYCQQWTAIHCATCTFDAVLFFNDIFSCCRSSTSSRSSSRPISTSLMSDAFVSTPRKFSPCLHFLLQRMSRDISEANEKKSKMAQNLKNGPSNLWPKQNFKLLYFQNRLLATILER